MLALLVGVVVLAVPVMVGGGGGGGGGSVGSGGGCDAGVGLVYGWSCGGLYSLVWVYSLV